MSRTRLIDRQTLNRHVVEDARVLQEGVARGAAKAAQKATATSRSRFRSRLVQPPRRQVAPRPGRPTTQGTFASHIDWNPRGNGNVAANIDKLQQVAPYWLVQEVGTERGMSAQGLVATPNGPVTQVVAGVPRQAGRVIPSGLTWSGNNPRMDQIVPGPRRQPITIRTEIKAKRYLRAGGLLGFRLYERELERAFSDAFGHHPKST